MKDDGHARANGPSGVFSNWGADNGSHHWLYWVVPVSAQFGEGVPLPAGHARDQRVRKHHREHSEDCRSIQLQNSQTGLGWRKPTAALSARNRKLFVDDGCTEFVRALTCSFTDNGGSYRRTRTREKSATTNVYMPRLDFWPGAIVLSPGEDVSSEHYSIPTSCCMPMCWSAGYVVTTQPAWAVAGEANTTCRVARITHPRQRISRRFIPRASVRFPEPRS